MMEKERIKFKGMTRPCTSLVLVSPRKISKFNIMVTKLLLKKENKGLYITIDKLYKDISRLLGSKGIKTDKLFFIDVMTKTTSRRPERTENCLFTNSPQSLTEISYAITQIVQVRPEINFLFIDSLSTLFYYNELDSVIRFIHFLVSATKALNMLSIFTILKETDKKIIKEIEPFFDKIIKIN
jgi:hypothetical protein